MFVNQAFTEKAFPYPGKIISQLRNCFQLVVVLINLKPGSQYDATRGRS